MPDTMTVIAHNHGPVKTGKPVDGCDACAELKSQEISKAELSDMLRNVADDPAPPKPVGTDQSSELQELIRLMASRERRAMQKEEDDIRRKDQAREDMRVAAQEQERMTALRQQYCGYEHGAPGSHTKENGRSAINGQIHNDGMFHPICFRCFKRFPPRRPTADQMPTGVTVN